MSVASNKSRVLHIDESNFKSTVLESDVPVLVDFYADWCGPCRRLGPVLDELATETPNVRIVKVNVDHAPRLAMQYGVEAIPAIRVFKGGKVTGQLVGLASKTQLSAMLTRG